MTQTFIKEIDTGIMSVSYWKASEILKTCQYIVKGSSFALVPPTQGKFAMQKKYTLQQKKKEEERNMPRFITQVTQVQCKRSVIAYTKFIFQINNQFTTVL